MTLPVPLTVRVGDQHITAQVQSLAFRREAVGGVRSISFALARPISSLEGMDPLTKVYVYDGRTAETVAEGRLTDTGRTASADGQRWECVAFGPAQHASDITHPKIFVDRSISDGWKMVDVTNPGASIGSSSLPNGGTGAAQGVLGTFPDGTPVVSNSRAVLRYDRIWQAVARIGFVGANWQAGLTDPLWRVEIITGTNGNFSTVAAGAGASTAGGVLGASVGTNFPNGDNTIGLRFTWVGGAATTVGDTTWAWWQDVCIEALRKTKAGVDITSGYTGSTVASSIVADLLGHGWLPDVDRVNATISTTTTTISQLSYPGGTTAAAVLDDLMGIEPAYRWYATPDATGLGYGFRWETWPTQVRYEATLDDGGSFPLSTQSVYNQVLVRWIDPSGADRSTIRTKACALLDGKGLLRQAQIDLGGEMGSDAQANAAGDAFLADHNVPKNAGTLTVARPIRDVLTGAMVQPWEIEAGELVRVIGVEAYPDAFNATSGDGQGVFRIFAMDYTTEGNVATLALDSDPRETEDALVKLLNERSRS